MQGIDEVDQAGHEGQGARVYFDRSSLHIDGGQNHCRAVQFAASIVPVIAW